MKKLLLLLPVLLTLVSCDQYNQNKKIAELEKKIEEVTTWKDNLIKYQIDPMSIAMQQNRTGEIVNRNIHEFAIFDPSFKGYQSINTSSGNLLVSLTNVKKYANGYKLTFNIGNPTLAKFVDANISVQYGRAYKETESYYEWEKNLKRVDATVDKEISPGLWSKVNVTLSPAKEEDLEYIRFYLFPNRLYLFIDQRNNDG